jgi:hypothetical protein
MLNTKFEIFCGDIEKQKKLLANVNLEVSLKKKGMCLICKNYTY